MAHGTDGIEIGCYFPAFLSQPSCTGLSIPATNCIEHGSVRTRCPHVAAMSLRGKTESLPQKKTSLEQGICRSVRRPSISAARSLQSIAGPWAKLCFYKVYSSLDELMGFGIFTHTTLERDFCPHVPRKMKSSERTCLLMLESKAPLRLSRVATTCCGKQ